MHLTQVEKEYIEKSSLCFEVTLFLTMLLKSQENHNSKRYWLNIIRKLIQYEDILFSNCLRVQALQKTFWD